MSSNVISVIFALYTTIKFDSLSSGIRNADHISQYCLLLERFSPALSAAAWIIPPRTRLACPYLLDITYQTHPKMTDMTHVYLRCAID